MVKKKEIQCTDHTGKTKFRTLTGTLPFLIFKPGNEGRSPNNIDCELLSGQGISKKCCISVAS